MQPPTALQKIVFFSVLVLAGFLEVSGQVSATVAKKSYRFLIKGQLKTMAKKAVVYLSWQEPWEMAEFFKADVVQGRFEIRGTMSQPSLGHLRIVTYSDSTRADQQVPWECDSRSVFLCEGTLVLTGSDSLATANLVSACPENKFLTTLDSTLAPLDQEQARITTTLQQAFSRKDTCLSKNLQSQLQTLKQKAEQVQHTFILEHPASYLSLNLLNDYVYQHASRRELRFSEALYSVLSHSVRTSPLGLALKERIDKAIHPLLGSAPPTLTLETTNGRKTTLPTMKGKVILLDFWASWCVPCRKEFPRLQSLYEQYKDEGFEVIGISLDHNVKSWKDAIQIDRLLWPQFRDTGPPFGGSASRAFRIRSLPSTLLIGKEGTIIGEHLNLEQLAAQLKKLFPGGATAQ